MPAPVALACRQLRGVDLHEPDAAVVGKPDVSPSVTLATMPEASTFEPVGSRLGADWSPRAAPDEKTAAPTAMRIPGSHARTSTLHGRPAQDALVADAAREAVGVEPLEQELRRAAADAEQVAEPGQRDPSRRARTRRRAPPARRRRRCARRVGRRRHARACPAPRESGPGRRRRP